MIDPAKRREYKKQKALVNTYTQSKRKYSFSSKSGQSVKVVQKPPEVKTAPLSSATKIEVCSDEPKSYAPFAYTFRNDHKVPATNLINTSNVWLPNEVEQVVNGRVVKCGYLSPSQINTFNGCKRLYYYEKIAKQKPQFRSKVNMWMGTSYHDMLEHAYLEKMKGNNPSKLELSALLASNLEDQFEEKAKEYRMESLCKNDPEEIDYKTLKDSTTFIRRKSAIFMDGVSGLKATEIQPGHMNIYERLVLNAKPLNTEKHVIYRHSFKEGGEVPISGLYDLKEIVDGEPCITDHKTVDKKTFDERDVKSHLQLGVYSLAEKVDRVSVNEIITPKLTKPGQFNKITSKRTQEDHDRLNDTLDSTIAAMKWAHENNVYEPNPNYMFCKSCSFYNICQK